MEMLERCQEHTFFAPPLVGAYERVEYLSSEWATLSHNELEKVSWWWLRQIERHLEELVAVTSKRNLVLPFLTTPQDLSYEAKEVMFRHEFNAHLRFRAHPFRRGIFNSLFAPIYYMTIEGGGFNIAEDLVDAFFVSMMEQLLEETLLWGREYYWELKKVGSDDAYRLLTRLEEVKLGEEEAYGWDWIYPASYKLARALEELGLSVETIFENPILVLGKERASLPSPAAVVFGILESFSKIKETKTANGTDALRAIADIIAHDGEESATGNIVSFNEASEYIKEMYSSAYAILRETESRSVHDPDEKLKMATLMILESILPQVTLEVSITGNKFKYRLIMPNIPEWDSLVNPIVATTAILLGVYVRVVAHTGLDFTKGQTYDLGDAGILKVPALTVDRRLNSAIKALLKDYSRIYRRTVGEYYKKGVERHGGKDGFLDFIGKQLSSGVKTRLPEKQA